MENNDVIGLLISIGTLTFLIGVFMGFYLEDNNCPAMNQSIKIDGIWTHNVSGLSKYSGTFICVNIDNVKTLRDLVTTCEHEAGHEIFARECEVNFDKCVELEK